MKSIGYLPIIAVTALLGACASPTPYDLNNAEVSALPQHGTEFQKALHRDYADLAMSEFVQADRRSTTYYNTKSRHASAGNAVLPTRMDERSIPSEDVAELTTAHANMMRVLDAGGPIRATAATSRAQTNFDCWMEQQEENFQPDHIEYCRNGYMSAMDQASGIVFAAAVPAPAPEVAAPATTPPMIDVASYIVYFDHDSSSLNGAATTRNDEISNRIKSTEATSVTVNGYTDRSGEREYNRLLAERRAATVASDLERSGIKPIVGSQSYGENRLAVQTADGVREWENRRVVVTLKK